MGGARGPEHKILTDEELIDGVALMVIGMHVVKIFVYCSNSP